MRIFILAESGTAVKAAETEIADRRGPFESAAVVACVEE
jgi:hypothetical protein